LFINADPLANRCGSPPRLRRIEIHTVVMLRACAGVQAEQLVAVQKAVALGSILA